jgi:hypothetical protein
MVTITLDETSDKVTISFLNKKGILCHKIISYTQLLKDNCDGVLSRNEIVLLNCGRKVEAIKQLMIRTGIDLKASKAVVDDWIKDNKCCTDFPYCLHLQKEQEMVNKLIIESYGNQMMAFTFPEKLSEEECRKIQELAGFPPDEHNFLSRSEEDNSTKWYCYRESTNKD